MKLVTAAEMKEIEQLAEDAGTGAGELMLNAGASLYEALTDQERFDPENEDNLLGDGLAIVLAGPGNNGGDAMVVSALLKEAFPEAYIRVYFYNRPRPEDPQGFPDKLTYTEAEEQEGLDLGEAGVLDDLKEDLQAASLVVDGLLGAGLSRPVGEDLAQIIKLVNAARAQRQFDLAPLYVVAIDVPSGLNSDSGEALGIAIEADLTVTMGFPKIGLYEYKAAEYTGQIAIGDIGLSEELIAQVEKSVEDEKAPAIVGADWVIRHLPRRPLLSHKGTYGKLMVVSGTKEYLGAPYLCTAAGMRTGAGLVTLAAPQSTISIMATKMSENTFLVLPEADSSEAARQAADLLTTKIKEGAYSALLLGPGLGNDPNKLALVQRLVELGSEGFAYPKMVVDADGLNLLAQIPDWFQKLPPENILTPHPGELATLRGISIQQIEQDRYKSALDAAKALNQVVILKGAYTVVAAPDGRLKIDPSANPAMSTAGSGDVLAGIAAGLLAQLVRADKQADAFTAACLAVYVHSMAGELVSRDYGNAGTLAGDFLQVIPQALNAIKNGDSLELV